MAEETPANTEGGSSSLSAISVIETTINPINISELTQVDFEGTGVLDVMLRNLRLHLDREWADARITGHEYATVFTDLFQSTQQAAIEYISRRTRLGYEIKNLEADAKYKEAQIQVQLAELEKVPHEINVLKAQEGQIRADTILVGVRTEGETANLAKIPVEVEVLRKESLKSDAQVALTNKQVEQLTAELTKIPVEVELLTKQVQVAQAGLEQTEAETERLTYENLNKLPVEVANLTKQGELLTSEVALSANKVEISRLEATKIPVEIEVMQAEIAYKAKQNLILEREYELKLGELGLQEKNIALAGAELNLRREELKVKLAQIEAQQSQAALYRQKVVTEKAQTDNSVVKPGSVIDLSNSVLAAQVKGYEFDAQNRLAKLLVDAFSVTYQGGDREVNSTNKLTDAEVGRVFTKMFTDLGIS